MSLELVEDVPIEEPVVGAVDMQCVLGRESCVDQQGKDLLEWPQGAQWSQAQWCGQRAGDQQRHDVGVAERQEAQVVGDAAQLCLPVLVVREDRQFVQDELGHPVKQGCPVGGVAVEAHRVPAQFLPEPPHGQGFEPFGIHEFQRRGQHQFTAQRLFAAGEPAVLGSLLRGDIDTNDIKGSTRTLEFAVYVAAVLATIITAAVVGDNASENGVDVFNASTAMQYITWLTVGFMVARGLAKAGNRNHNRA